MRTLQIQYTTHWPQDVNGVQFTSHRLHRPPWERVRSEHRVSTSQGSISEDLRRPLQLMPQAGGQNAGRRWKGCAGSKSTWSQRPRCGDRRVEDLQRTENRKRGREEHSCGAGCGKMCEKTSLGVKIVDFPMCLTLGKCQHPSFTGTTIPMIPCRRKMALRCLRAGHLRHSASRAVPRWCPTHAQPVLFSVKPVS